MMDPTIPRGNLQASARSTWGWFEKRGARVVLRSRDGNDWPAGLGGMVQWATGPNSSSVEGFHRAPRPFEYDAKGNVTVQGDYVIIDFMGGDPRHPIVRPGPRPQAPDDADFFPSQPIGQDPNPVRLRLAARDAAGAVSGTVQVTALDGGNQLELVVGGATFGEGVKITLDFDAGNVQIIGDTSVVVQGDEVTAKTGEMKVYQTTDALTSAVLVDGLAAVSFHTKLAASLSEIATKLAVLHGPSPVTLELVGLLGASTYKAGRLKAE